MRLETTIIEFCGFAAQNGFSSSETLEDYVGTVQNAVYGLEVGEVYELCRVNTRECARHSILKYIYVEIVENHPRLINNRNNTKGQKWEIFTEDLPEEEEVSMFETEKLVIKRIK